MEFGGVESGGIIAGAGASVGTAAMTEIVVVDVVFDYGAAARASGELRRSATGLRELLQERAIARHALLTIWSGPAAERHANDFARTQAEGHRLADRLHWTAARIEDAADTARREQRRREEDATGKQLAAAGLAW